MPSAHRASETYLKVSFRVVQHRLWLDVYIDLCFWNPLVANGSPFHYVCLNPILVIGMFVCSNQRLSVTSLSSFSNSGARKGDLADISQVWYPLSGLYA